jgi:hypothetical protein
MKLYQWAVSLGLGALIVLGTIFMVLTPTPNQVPVQVKSDFSYTNASHDVVQVELPFPGAVTGKTFSVIGKARGTWFFEASFPVVVLDKDGKQLAAVPAQAQGEWMTNDFVAFKADITVPNSYIGPATLVLKKDNPSGEVERDASVSFPFTIEY